MTAKKKTAEEESPDLLTTKCWSITTRDGFSSVSRFTKTFYIPDEEMLELHTLLTVWKAKHDTDK